MARIEAATPADARHLAEVHIAAWQAGYRGLLPADRLAALSVRASTERWTELLTQPQAGQSVWLARRDGLAEPAIAGFAVIGASRDPGAGSTVGELRAIYVHPACWRLGIGTALHDTSIKGLLAGGFTEATLWVLDGNTRAETFYRRAGWVADGGRKEEQGPQCTWLVEQRMRIALRSAHPPPGVPPPTQLH